MPASTPTRAIDRLRKAANLEPTKKNVELSDGSTFEMWVSPLTMAERERAQKQAKSDDANAFALQLLISKALDENGSQALRPRRNRRTQERSQGQGSPDPNAGNPHRRLRAYGPKVLAAELRKDNWLMLQFGVAKELGLSLTDSLHHLHPRRTPGLERLLQHPERGPAKGNRQSQTPPLTPAASFCLKLGHWSVIRHRGIQSRHRNWCKRCRPA
jgi:hypothetical protein